MRKLLLTTTLVLPLSMGAAFAQDTAPATEPADAPMTDMGTAPAADPMADPMAETTSDDAAEAAAAESAAGKVEVEQAANEWRVDWITGTTVNAPDGTSIGSINDVIINGETGEMKAVIVGVGGFLGIGEKQIALPWADLTINSDAQEITADLTREEADAAPEYVFRDRDTGAGMMTDPAGDPAMAPAADPMATGADPMATEQPADPMATGGMGDAPMTDDPANNDTSMDDTGMTTEDTLETAPEPQSDEAAVPPADPTADGMTSQPQDGMGDGTQDQPEADPNSPVTN